MGKKGQLTLAREAARENAMRLAYEWSMGGAGELSTLMQFSDVYPIAAADMDYLCAVVEGIKQKQQELDDLIERHSIDWKLERLAKVELAILRIAVYEMAYSQDVPTAVAMHEAVELAKRYCRAQAPPFINGVLAAVQVELGQANALAFVQQ